VCRKESGKARRDANYIVKTPPKSIMKSCTNRSSNSTGGQRDDAGLQGRGIKVDHESVFAEGSPILLDVAKGPTPATSVVVRLAVAEKPQQLGRQPGTEAQNAVIFGTEACSRRARHDKRLEVSSFGRKSQRSRKKRRSNRQQGEVRS